MNLNTQFSNFFFLQFMFFFKKNPGNNLVRVGNNKKKPPFWQVIQNTSDFLKSDEVEQTRLQILMSRTRKNIFVVKVSTPHQKKKFFLALLTSDAPQCFIHF